MLRVRMDENTGSGFGNFVLEQKYPSMTGFRTIYNIDPELLEGMLDGDSLRVVRVDLKSKEFCKWILELLDYFYSQEDLKQIFKFFTVGLDYHFDNGAGIHYNTLEIGNYLKIMSKIRDV